MSAPRFLRSGAAAVLAAAALSPPAPLPAAAPAAALGKVGLACQRTVNAAHDAIAAGQTRIGYFDIEWSVLPPRGAKTAAMCGCVEAAFKAAGTARANIVSLSLVQSNKGELLWTETINSRRFALMRSGRYGGGEQSVGISNAGSEGRETLVGYAMFLDRVAQCGVTHAGPGYSNALFRDVPKFRGVTISE
jgi:hypothetical protein